MHVLLTFRMAFLFMELLLFLPSLFNLFEMLRLQLFTAT